MQKKMQDWNVTNDFFVVSDMGSYLNVFQAHHYTSNLSEAMIVDFHAGSSATRFD